MRTANNWRGLGFLRCVFNRGVVCGVCLVSSLPVIAAPGLVSGHYQFQTLLSPVCLNGRYPVTIGEIPGAELSLTTDSIGRVTGTLHMWDNAVPLSGTLKTTKASVRLVLRGSNKGQKMTISALLRGSEFVGTAKTKAGQQTCTLNVSATAPLSATYDLMLAVNASGKVTGSGTMTACRTNIAVTATGSTTAKRSVLNLKGAKVTWKGGGAPAEGGFRAQWTAKGFGAAVAGKNLAVVARPP